MYFKLSVLSTSFLLISKILQLKLKIINKNLNKIKLYYFIFSSNIIKRFKLSTIFLIDLIKVISNSITIVTIFNHYKTKFMNITKMYTNKIKYKSEKNSFVQKLTIFHNFCDCVKMKKKLEYYQLC